MQQAGEIKQSLIEIITKSKNLFGDKHAAELLRTVENTNQVHALFRMRQELVEVIAELASEMDPDAEPMDTSFKVTVQNGELLTFKKYDDFLNYVKNHHLNNHQGLSVGASTHDKLS